MLGGEFSNVTNQGFFFLKKLQKKKHDCFYAQTTIMT